MLRICLDVRNIKSIKTGLGRYALNLLGGIADLDSDNEYILLKHPSYRNRIIDRPNFRELPLADDISSVRSVLTHSKVINRLKPDVYHALMHFLPFGLDCPRTLVTLHDLIWIESPHLAFTNRLKALYNRHIKGRFIKHAVRRADIVIVISEATRQRAIEVLGVPSSKCHLIYHGVEEKFLTGESQKRSADVPAHERLKFFSGVGEQYIISLGHTKPYKNVEGIIKAFNLIRSTHADVKLVIVGRGDRYPVLRRLVEELRLGDRVLFWSSRTDTELSDADIILLFRHAKMLVFPSFVEGFGFPIVEAMAVGCPVLTSNVSAPKEIAADAGLLVNPHNVNEIAAGNGETADRRDVKA